jgi:hypothetical protein
MHTTDSRSAGDVAAARVATVTDDVEGRYRLAGEFYLGPRRLHRFARAELRFTRALIARGVLNPTAARRPGSRWWRAVNERLLRDKLEARLLVERRRGPPSAPSVAYWRHFLEAPSRSTWYRAHNASVVDAYLVHEPLALREQRVERFMMNVALLRVQYAHALVAAPRLALGTLAPLAPLLGDPRSGTVGLFLHLHRHFPLRYPLPAGDLLLGPVVDRGIIMTRADDLYRFSAEALALPKVVELIADGVPSYAAPGSGPATWFDGRDRRLSRFVASVTRHRA